MGGRVFPPGGWDGWGPPKTVQKVVRGALFEGAGGARFIGAQWGILVKKCELREKIEI